MNKVALVLWSLFPRKVNQSYTVMGSSNGGDYRLTFIWLGKTFRVKLK